MDPNATSSSSQFMPNTLYISRFKFLEILICFHFCLLNSIYNLNLIELTPMARITIVYRCKFTNLAIPNTKNNVNSITDF